MYLNDMIQRHITANVLFRYRPTQQFIVQECIDVTIRRIQMQPKTLQKLLGHGSLQMTMDLYCHVTEDTLFEAMELMECAM